MVERFTREARTAVVAAQEVARGAGSRAIDTRHLVVALARTGEASADALRLTGAEPGALDAPGRSGGGHVPFRRDAKKSLELSLRETIRLGGKQIDSGTLLLGILRADRPGRTALETSGIDLVLLRAALEPPEARSA